MSLNMNFSFNDAYRVIKNVIDERVSALTKSGAGIEVTWGTVASIDAEAMCSVYLPGETIPSSGFRLENGIKPNLLDPVRISIDKRGNRWIDAVLNNSTTAYPKLEIDPRGGAVRVGDGTAPPTPLGLQPDLVSAPDGIQLHGTSVVPANQGIQFGDDVQLYRSGIETLVMDGVLQPTSVKVGDSNYNAGSIELRTNAGSSFIDFTNDLAADYDARLIYSPAIFGDEYLHVVNKTFKVDSGLVSGTTVNTLAGGSRFYGPSGHTIPSGGSTLGALELYNPSTTTGDTYISFHNPGRYGAHFGLDGSTSDLFFGGWSRGAKYRVWHAGNSQPLKFYGSQATIVSQTATASIGLTATGSGAPANSIVILELRLTSATANANNWLAAAYSDGTHAGVTYAGAVAGYNNTIVCPVLAGSDATIRWQFNYGNGTNTINIIRRGYWAP